MMRVALVWLMWVVILLLPLLIAAWIAHLSRASALLVLAPMLLMAWVLASINGTGLMPWHAVRPARPQGMSFSFELSVLGIFYLWPATLVCLGVWAMAKRWLRRRAVQAQAPCPTPEGPDDGPARP